MALYRDFTITVDDELDRAIVPACCSPGLEVTARVAYAPYIVGSSNWLFARSFSPSEDAAADACARNSPRFTGGSGAYAIAPGNVVR